MAKVQKKWSVEENTPGCLPESDPEIYYTRNEAVEAIQHRVDEILDQEELADLPEGERMEVVAGSPEELHVQLGRPSDPNDRGRVIEAQEYDIDEEIG